MDNPCKKCIVYAICYSQYKYLSTKEDKTLAIRVLMHKCMYLREFMTKKLEHRVRKTNVIITGRGPRNVVYLETPFQLGVRVGFSYYEIK